MYGASKKQQEPARITKVEVVYIEPRHGEGHRFAQCGTCRFFASGSARCALLGPGIDVGENDVCTQYAPGRYSGERIATTFTPQEVGFTKDTQVRCENCRWGGSICQ